MILDTTYRDTMSKKRLINDLGRKVLTPILQSLRLGGIGSKRMIISTK